MGTVSSVITSKFQVTIPKAVRENLKLSVNDTLSWEIDGERIVVATQKNAFIGHKNTIRVGRGNIRNDIELARKLTLEKFR